MIKGVNKKVIEINRPDSVYFERAVLYLRPDVTEVPPHEAQAAAEDYLHQPFTGRSGGKLRSLFLFLLGAATSAGIFTLIIWLIS